VLRRRAHQVTPASAANRRPQIQTLLLGVQEVLGGVDVPAGAEEAAKVIPDFPPLCIGRVVLRVSEDAGEKAVGMVLVAVGRFVPSESCSAELVRVKL
jgi:hypothetical protein